MSCVRSHVRRAVPCAALLQCAVMMRCDAMLVVPKFVLFARTLRPDIAFQGLIFLVPRHQSHLIQTASK